MTNNELKNKADKLEEKVNRLTLELESANKRALFWETSSKKESASGEYYQKELEKSHALLGRVVHQASERWDSINLTKYYPTDNLSHKRSVVNPKGDTKEV